MRYWLKLCAAVVWWVLPASLVCLSAAAAPITTAQAETPALKITLLGTGNPRPTPERSGPAILVEANTQPPTRILIDAGRGAAERLFEVGGREALSGIDCVVLTHLHSDHVVGLPDLWLTGWIFGRAKPLMLRGPAGTTEMMHHLEAAYAFDVHMRRDVDERLPANGIAVDALDLKPDAPFELNGVKITPFLVDHGPVKPAYGWKIEHNGHSVVFSGDTRKCENVARYANGCDVLVHEVIVPDVEKRLSLMRDPAATQRVIDHHTTPEEAGEVFAAAHPRLAVFSHIVPSPATTRDVENAVRRRYKGRIAVGVDRMVIEIGTQITVSHPSHR
jgi:ribonuclease Z